VTTTEPLSTSCSTVVDAPADVVHAVVADVAAWPQLTTGVVHVDVHPDATRPGSPVTTDTVQVWSLGGPGTVRAWTSARRVDPVARTVDFRTTCPGGPARPGGRWSVREDGPDRSVLTVEHHVDPAGWGDRSAFELAVGRLRTHARTQLEELARAAERHDDLAELTVSFEDTVAVAGDVEDVWEVLYRADRWPSRFPHVTSLDLVEDVPGVQFFTMGTLTPDGRAHSTDSVRVCLPTDLIVYKQTTLAPLLSAHTGHWRFVTTPEGVLASARHTATIRRENLHLLAPGATVEDARTYLRRSLSANSVANLQFARRYAEDLAADRARRRVPRPLGQVVGA
jgi:hypothetical protein